MVGRFNKNSRVATPLPPDEVKRLASFGYDRAGMARHFKMRYSSFCRRVADSQSLQDAIAAGEKIFEENYTEGIKE